MWQISQEHNTHGWARSGSDQALNNEYETLFSQRWGFQAFANKLKQLAEKARAKFLARPDVAKWLDEQATAGIEFNNAWNQAMYRRIPEQMPAPLGEEARIDRRERYTRQLEDMVARVNDESFKLIPWMFRELKKVDHDDLGTGLPPQPFFDANKNSEITHWLDLVNQIGTTFHSQRQNNRPTPDINQMSYGEALAWAEKTIQENMVNGWEDPEHVYTFSNGWTIDLVKTKRDLAREGDLMGHCFPAGTLVNAKVPTPIEQLKVGDEVMGHDGKWHQITELLRKPFTGNLVVLENRANLPIRCTPEHPILVLRPQSTRSAFQDRYLAKRFPVDLRPEWIQAKDIQVGDRLLSPTPQFDSGADEVAPWESNTDVAWWLGVYAGDGSNNAGSGFEIVASLHDDADRISSVAETYFGIKTSIRDFDSYRRIRGNSRDLANHLIEACGSGSANKKLPRFLFDGSWDTQSALDGLLSADGCYVEDEDRYVFTSTSLVMAQQVWLLASANNKLPSLRPIKRYSGYANAKPSWKVEWKNSKGGWHSNMRHGEYYTTEVTSISQEAHDDVVYNFEVSDSHSYLVNGFAVHNCVGGYCSFVASGETAIYSLRDPKGDPHVTIEIRPSSDNHPDFDPEYEVIQVHGKGNAEPKPEYQKMVTEYFKHFQETNGYLRWEGSGQMNGIANDVSITDPEDLADWYESYDGEPEKGPYGLERVQEQSFFMSDSALDKAIGSFVNDRSGIYNPLDIEDTGKALFLASWLEGWNPQNMTEEGFYLVNGWVDSLYEDFGYQTSEARERLNRSHGADYYINHEFEYMVPYTELQVDHPDPDSLDWDQEDPENYGFDPNTADNRYYNAYENALIEHRDEIQAEEIDDYAGDCYRLLTYINWLSQLFPFKKGSPPPHPDALPSIRQMPEGRERWEQKPLNFDPENRWVQQTASKDPDDTTTFLIAADYNMDLGEELRQEVFSGQWSPGRLQDIAHRHSENGLLPLDAGNHLPLNVVDWEMVGMHYEEEERLQDDNPVTMPNTVPTGWVPVSDNPKQIEDMVRGASWKTARLSEVELDSVEIGDTVQTIVGPATVLQKAKTPLGWVFRCATEYDNDVDFMEHEIVSVRPLVTASWIPQLGDRVLLKPDLVKNLTWKPKDPRWEADMLSYPEGTIVEIMDDSGMRNPLFRIKGDLIEGLLVTKEQITPLRDTSNDGQAPQVPDALPAHWGRVSSWEMSDEEFTTLVEKIASDILDVLATRPDIASPRSFWGSMGSHYVEWGYDLDEDGDPHNTAKVRISNHRQRSRNHFPPGAEVIIESSDVSYDPKQLIEQAMGMQPSKYGHWRQSTADVEGTFHRYLKQGMTVFEAFRATMEELGGSEEVRSVLESVIQKHMDLTNEVQGVAPAAKKDQTVMLSPTNRANPEGVSYMTPPPAWRKQLEQSPMKYQGSWEPNLGDNVRVRDRYRFWFDEYRPSEAAPYSGVVTDISEETPHTYQVTYLSGKSDWWEADDLELDRPIMNPFAQTENESEALVRNAWRVVPSRSQRFVMLAKSWKTKANEYRQRMQKDDSVPEEIKQEILALPDRTAILWDWAFKMVRRGEINEENLVHATHVIQEASDIIHEKNSNNRKIPKDLLRGGFDEVNRYVTMERGLSAVERGENYDPEGDAEKVAELPNGYSVWLANYEGQRSISTEMGNCSGWDFHLEEVSEGKALFYFIQNPDGEKEIVIKLVPRASAAANADKGPWTDQPYNQNYWVVSEVESTGGGQGAGHYSRKRLTPEQRTMVDLFLQSPQSATTVVDGEVRMPNGSKQLLKNGEVESQEIIKYDGEGAREELIARAMENPEYLSHGPDFEINDVSELLDYFHTLKNEPYQFDYDQEPELDQRHDGSYVYWEYSPRDLEVDLPAVEKIIHESINEFIDGGMESGELQEIITAAFFAIHHKVQLINSRYNEAAEFNPDEEWQRITNGVAATMPQGWVPVPEEQQLFDTEELTNPWAVQRREVQPVVDYMMQLGQAQVPDLPVPDGNSYGRSRGWLEMSPQTHQDVSEGRWHAREPSKSFFGQNNIVGMDGVPHPDVATYQRQQEIWKPIAEQREREQQLQRNRNQFNDMFAGGVDYGPNNHPVYPVRPVRENNPTNLNNPDWNLSLAKLAYTLDGEGPYGYTNWDTSTVALEIENGGLPRLQKAQQLIRGGATPEQFAAWASEEIIAPYNQSAIKDAQEWNVIPQDERVDFDFEELKSKVGPELAETWGNPQVDDVSADVITESKVNWYEIMEVMRDFMAEDEPELEQPMTLPEHWSRVASQMFNVGDRVITEFRWTGVVIATKASEDGQVVTVKRDSDRHITQFFADRLQHISETGQKILDQGPRRDAPIDYRPPRWHNFDRQLWETIQDSPMRMGNSNDSLSVVQRTLQNRGGTFHPNTLQDFVGPAGSYQVSLPKTEVERSIPITDEQALANETEKYRVEFGHLLALPDHYLGTWVNDSQFVLDVSTVIVGLDAAMDKARQWGQDAIWSWDLHRAGDFDNAAIPVPRVEHTAAANHNGVMVALYPDPSSVEHLVVPDGEPLEDLHVTLAFLGEANTRRDWDRAYDVIEHVASSFQPLSGSLEGSNTFNGAEVVNYAQVDVQGLAALRSRLVSELRSAGFEIDDRFEFVPHMTLKYSDHDENLDVPPTSVTFDTVTLKVADQRYDIELGEAPAPDIQEEMSEIAPIVAKTETDIDKLAKSIEKMAQRPVSVSVTMPEINLTPQINVEQPKFEVPDIHLSPEIKVAAPTINMPEITMPEIKMPEIKIPKVEMPEIHNHIQQSSPRKAVASRDKEGKLVVEYQDTE